MLSPIIPVHRRHSPVSPIIPALTQNIGGGDFFCFLRFLHLLCFHYFLPVRHSPLTPIIPAPLATAALRVVPAPIFTTTLRIHVGAPTFLECGGLPPLLRLTKRRVMNGLRETGGVAKAGASSRTPRPACASTTG